MSKPLILLVEDNPVIQMLLRMQLDRLGYQCKVVGTGEEAVDQQAEISMILMDIGLPGIDGLKTTALIRKQEQDEHRKPVPIVAYTAHSDQARCLSAGMDAFLQKPVTLEQLRKVIQQFLPEIESRA
jgi:CheY-like chemotaxis protein